MFKSIIHSTAIAVVAATVLTGCSANTANMSPEESLCSQLDPVVANAIEIAQNGGDYMPEIEKMEKIAFSVETEGFSPKMNEAWVAMTLATAMATSGNFDISSSQLGQGISYMRVACKDAGFPLVETEKN